MIIAAFGFMVMAVISYLCYLCASAEISLLFCSKPALAGPLSCYAISLLRIMFLGIKILQPTASHNIMMDGYLLGLHNGHRLPPPPSPSHCWHPSKHSTPCYSVLEAQLLGSIAIYNGWSPKLADKEKIVK